MTQSKITLSFLLTLFTHVFAFGQYNLPHNNVWAFGNKVGLDFSTTPPTKIVTSITGNNEGHASVCDPNGRLLFYTSGTRIWNALGDLMPNGTNINGPGLNTASTTQASVIVPYPGQPNKYFVFALTPVSNCRLFVNIVDMSLDDGKGDIDLTFPLHEQLIKDNLTEKMIAIPGCDNSVWLMVRSGISNTFIAYHITEQGLNETPVESVAGNLSSNAYYQGVMKVSPDGKRILTTTFRSGNPDTALEVYDFDAATGRVSNTVFVDNINAYGATFSPKGDKIYAQAITSPGSVYQFDLNAIGQESGKVYLGKSGQYADMKLAPDGKIYVAAPFQSPVYNSYSFFACINNPDLPGLDCAFKDSITSLSFSINNTSGAITQGLPNDVVIGHAVTPTVGRMIQEVYKCETEPFTQTLSAASTGLSNYTWSTGETTESITANEFGTYTVAYQLGCATLRDSFKILMDVVETPTLVLNGSVLSTVEPYDNYTWFLNDIELTETTNTLEILENGDYSVVVSNGTSCEARADYSIHNLATNKLAVNTGFVAFPNPVSANLEITTPKAGRLTLTDVNSRLLSETQAEKGQTKIAFEHLPQGIYILQFTTSEGEISTKKIVKQ